MLIRNLHRTSRIIFHQASRYYGSDKLTYKINHHEEFRIAYHLFLFWFGVFKLISIFYMQYFKGTYISQLICIFRSSWHLDNGVQVEYMIHLLIPLYFQRIFSLDQACIDSYFLLASEKYFTAPSWLPSCLLKGLLSNFSFMDIISFFTGYCHDSFLCHLF